MKVNTEDKDEMEIQNKYKRWNKRTGIGKEIKIE